MDMDMEGNTDNGDMSMAKTKINNFKKSTFLSKALFFGLANRETLAIILGGDIERS